MQQFQSLGRLLIFYALTLLIMLSLYYVMMFFAFKEQNQQHSQFVFRVLNHEVTEHNATTDSGIEEILTKPFFQDISYQLIFMLPSGQTYVHQHTQPDERKFNNVTFSATNYLPTTNSNSYQINSYRLMGQIKLESGHQVYVVLRHQPVDINWLSYQIWLPLMSAILLFGLALLYMLKRRTNWDQLLRYTENLIASTKEAYTPPAFINVETTPEFVRLGHALSRVSYQLHNHHRRIKTLRQRLEHLVNQAPLPMLMVMRQGQISFFNQRFEQIFTTTFQRDSNYSLTDFVTGSDKATQQQLQKLATLRVTRTLLVYGLVDKQAYQLHIAPWFGTHGQVHGFTVLLNNINKLTEQIDHLQFENQQLHSQLKESTKLRFVIGHELRTPLNAIIGTLGLIDAHKLSTQQQEVLATLTHSSQSMLTMLNDMLDTAKISAGKSDLITESTDIYKLGQNISDLMIGSARRQGIDLLYFFAPKCPRYICTESSRLRQILLNLLDNAIKFTSSGYVALVIEPLSYEQMYKIDDIKVARTLATTTFKKDSTHQWIRFSVKDTGIGIAATEQHKLFSYFNQANINISQNFGGTGLGLAISNSFAQLLGGFIQLNSEFNKGSDFALYLPCQSPIYQPIYHFHSHLTRVRLIFIVENELCANFIAPICEYLSIPVTIYTRLDDKNINQLNNELAYDNEELTSVLLLDYEYYETHIAIAPHASMSTQTSTKEGTSVAHNNDNHDVVNRLLNHSTLAKILFSMKPERNIPSTLLDQFDSFLNKPLDVTLLLSELIRLTQSETNTQKRNHTVKNIVNDVDHINKKPLSKKQIEQSIEKASVSGSRQPLILVVDDNITNQKITCKLLDKLGYNSIVSVDGKQALEKLETQRQDITLILMDCRMPVMDGIQATKAIRAQGDNIAIIALTANSTKEDQEACYRAGMNGFLEKPINLDKLLTMLKGFIGADL
ncbi:response regulator [uncultured Psychrobacter sp.]|uniref:response regulator n=1 Tax=uncultured Psychrobacter sp. TaxID=259303 RepID=UPI00345A7AE7